MEVRIGIKGAPRELAIDSTQSAEEIQSAIEDALKGGAATFALVDEKGRRVVIVADKLAYVEIAETEGRRVGFGTM